MKYIFFIILLPFTYADAQNLERKYVVDHGEIYISDFDSTGYTVSAETPSQQVYYKFTDSAKDTVQMYEEAKKSLANHLDTLNFKGLDSIEIDADNKRVTLIREKPNFDWVKYILPIVTLILGFLLHYFRDKYNEHVQIEATGKRWVAEYSNLADIIDKQLMSLKDLTTDVNSNFPWIGNIHFEEGLSCSAFDSLDSNLMFKYLEKKSETYEDATKLNRKINSEIYALKMNSQGVNNLSIDYKQGVGICYEKLNNGIQKVEVLFVEFINLIGVSSNEGLNQKLVDIQVFGSGSERPDPFQFKSDTIQGAIELLNRYPEAKELRDALGECSNTITGLEREKTYLMTNISQIENILATHKERIMGVKRILSSLG